MSSSPSERLKQLLADSHMTQKDLAEAIHYSSKQINRLCQGHDAITPTAADIICKVFPGTLPAWLLGYHNFRTQTDFDRAQSNFSKTWHKETNLDNAIIPFFEAVGYSPSIGEDQNGDLKVFIQRLSDGAEIPIDKETFNCIRHTITSFAEFSFARLFTEKGGTDVST